MQRCLVLTHRGSSALGLFEAPAARVLWLALGHSDHRAIVLLQRDSEK